MRVILAGLALSCLATAAHARDYTIDDMLALESYGKVSISPGGRIAVIERNGRFDSASRFTYGFVTRRLTSQVMTLDLTHPGSLVPAFAQEKSAGYWTGTFSPSGRWLTVFRMRDDHLTLGILDIASHRVRWLSGAPDLPISTPSPLWLDDGRITYARFVSERLPAILDAGGIVQKTSPRRWEVAAQGREAADLASSSFKGTIERERRELVVADVDAGSERIIASGEIFDLQLSPSGKEVAVLELGDASSPDPGRPVTNFYIGRRIRLRIMDTDGGGVVVPCADCDVARGSLTFSREGRLAFIARRDGEDWSKARGHVFDDRGLKTQAVGAAAPAQLEWIGNQLLARSNDGEWSTTCLPSGCSTVRAVGKFSFVGSSDNALWLSDERGLWRLDDRLKQTLVSRPGFTTTDIDFEDSSSIGSNRLRRPELPVLRYKGQSADRLVFGFERGAPSTIPVPSEAKVLAASRTVGTALTFVTDDHGVGRMYLASDRSPPRVVDLISASLAEVDPPRSVALPRKIGNIPAVDWLILPKGDGPFPLVVFPYQGAIGGDALPLQARPGWFGPAFKAQVLTSAGYAVLFPSLPAGPPTHPQDSLVGDLDVAVDAAIATGFVDRNRLAIFGHSYGGMNALTIATRSSRYRAIISANTMNELAGMYGSVPPGQRVSFVGGPPLDLLNWFENGQSQMLAPPWEEPERYRQASPLFAANKVIVPVLLIASDLDYAPIEQAEHLFASLVRLGRDATLLRAYGEGHVFQGPGNIRLEYETVLKFLREKMPAAGARPVSSGHVQ